MGAQDNGLTLEGLAQRMEALERENAELRDEVSALRNSGMPRSEVPALRDSGIHHTEEPATEPEGRVSRKWLLSKAGAAAAGLVVAGALTQTDIREAKAAQLIGDSTQEFRGGVEGSNTNSFGYGVMGRAPNAWGVDGQGGRAGVRGFSMTGDGVEGSTSSSARAGVYGENASTGPSVHGLNINKGIGVLGKSTDAIGVKGVGKHGVYGESSTAGAGAVEGHNDGGGTGVVGVGKVGILALSHTDGWIAAWGRHTGNGYGVAGDSAGGVGVLGEASSEGKQGVFGRAKGNSQGVAGEGLNGTGVLGKGKTGVVGASTGAGYGGLFQGGKAQLRLVPKGTVGRPTTGSHAKGEIYMDKAGALFVCVAGGNPATWRKVSTTAV